MISNISSGSPLNSLSTSGGDFVTITGDFFGDVENALNASYSVNTENVDESVLATSVFHAIDCTLQIPHEKIICSTVAGVGGGLQWSVGVSNQISTQSDKITSYKSPVITAISSSAFPKLRGFNTSGGDSITISGSNFGPQYPTNIVSAHYINANILGLGGSLFSASSCTVKIADSSIICTTSEGVGFEQTWSVKVGLQSSPPLVTQTTSYATPSIKGIAPEVLKTDGTTSITLTGDNFGPRSALNFVNVTYRSINSTNANITNTEHKAIKCVVVKPHRTVECDSSAEGIGGGLSFDITVGAQRSNRSLVTISYAEPNVYNLAPVGSLRTIGGDRITITGDNFGPSHFAYNLPLVYYRTAPGTADATDLALLQKKAKDCSISQDHTEIVCWKQT